MYCTDIHTSKAINKKKERGGLSKEQPLAGSHGPAVNDMGARRQLSQPVKVVTEQEGGINTVSHFWRQVTRLLNVCTSVVGGITPFSLELCGKLPSASDGEVAGASQ